MSENNRTLKSLKINPDLFKLNGKLKKEKNKSIKRNKPIIDEENSSKSNKIKKEMMKKVKDFQRNKEKEQEKEDRNKNVEKENLFEKNTYENSDFDREYNRTLNFLQDLANKNKEKKKKQKTLKTRIPNVEINLNLSEDLENKSNGVNGYSNLKNGSKPTYRELNKTQKNVAGYKPKVKIVLENNVYDDEKKEDLSSGTKDKNLISPGVEFSSVEEKREEIVLAKSLPEKKLDKEVEEISKKSEIIELSSKPFMDEGIIEEINEINNLGIIDKDKEIKIKKQEDLKKIPKLNRITRRSTYKVGKIKGKNRVGILIKNRETQKNIKEEISSLKQKSIQDIKNHLRSKNLIKVGCDAPNDVLRKMYEDSILLGEVNNKNNNNMIFNYLNES